MLTGRRFRLFAVVFVVAIVTVTAGCRRRSGSRTTINQGGNEIFTTDEFPGAPVQDGNVADDGRAFSLSGDDVDSSSLRITFNGDSCVAMVTYAVTSGLVYAHHYDGGTWTPPVALTAHDCSYDQTDTGIIHAFINTSEHASDAAAARDGDCIIFWKAPDTDEGAPTDDVNICLWATYFDVTDRDNPGLNCGFDVFATRVSNLEDTSEEDVDAFGLATDGLCGQAWWSNNSGPFYTYGDQTTGIVVFWQQKEDTDGNGLASGGTTDESYLGSAYYDLAQATPEDLPLVPSANTRHTVVGFGASDSGVDRFETLISGQLTSYNNVVFLKAVSEDGITPESNLLFPPFFIDTTPLDGNDSTVQFHAFDLTTGSFTGAQHIHEGTPDSTDTDENNAEWIRPGAIDRASSGSNNRPFGEGRAIYGSDEGLANLVIFTGQLIEDANGVSTDPTDNIGLVVTEIDEATGTILEGAFIDIEDPDIEDRIRMEEVDTRISRNGDYIMIAWKERVDSGASDEVGVWIAQYTTTRPDEDGLFTIPALADSLSAPLNVNADVDGETVTWITWQHCLEYTCGAQSDPDVMNLFFQQSDGTFDEIDQVVVTADLVGAPTLPLFLTSVFEVYENGDQPGVALQDVNVTGFNFRAVDGGEDGNVFAVDVDDVDGTGTDDYRLFATRTGVSGGTVEIDTAVAFRTVPFQNIELVCTPRGSEIGRFDPVSLEDDDARRHAVENVHVIFAESESTELLPGLALRTRQFSAGDSGLTFGDSFIPNAGSTFQDPFDLDVPAGDVGDASVIGIAQQGNQVGLWFTQASHVYYQEFSSDNEDEDVGWLQVDGVSDPNLVDDDNDEEIQGSTTFATRSCACDTLSCATVFWTKAYGSGAGGGLSERLQVRVRE